MEKKCHADLFACNMRTHLDNSTTHIIPQSYVLVFRNHLPRFMFGLDANSVQKRLISAP